MNYIIHTPSAARLKKEILESVSAKADARSSSARLLPEGRKNGKGITTWQCVETGASERVLVHTADQWAEKGCIALKQDPERNELQVRFYYWDSCEDQSVGDDKIMLGRFTELILVHFSYYVDKIIIE